MTEALQRLRDNPPKRRGYATKTGWSGESEAVYRQRVEAWEAAVRRESGRE